MTTTTDDLKEIILTAVKANMTTAEEIIGEDDADLFESVDEYLDFASPTALANIALKFGLVEPEPQYLIDIYGALESAAARCVHLNVSPPTEYQLGHLAGLIEDHGDRVQDICSSNDVLTEAKAVRLIDSYLK